MALRSRAALAAATVCTATGVLTGLSGTAWAGIGGAAVKPATVVPFDGASCNTLSDGTGDVCLYFSGAGGSAFRGYYSPVADFGGDLFPNNGSGGGTRVKNNAHDARNFDFVFTAHICFNENSGGPCDTFAPGAGRRALIPSVINNNASLFWS